MANPDDPSELDAPPRSSWLLHPLSISLGLALLFAGTCAYREHSATARRQAEDEALAPLTAEWTTLAEKARTRLGALEALLEDADAAPEDGCAALSGPLTIIHRPLVTALTEGAAFPRTGPVWLSSDAWSYVAQSITPGRDVAGHRARLETVRAALDDPCVGVIVTALAEEAKLASARRFEGGAVAGRLQIVCLDARRVACELPVVSAPLLAVSVDQRDARAQAGADDYAVRSAARSSYWRAIEELLARRAPGLTLASPTW
ncbi:MAG: hypothetical protein KC636_21085 [Myxococcales bacterium]|nr:hypothetical protein [Myxococcales bacterium]